MGDERSQLDPVENRLVELRAAEEAGVFNRTELDAEALLRGGLAARPAFHWRFALRWVAMAAAVALAVGVWSTMFASKIGEGRGGHAALPVTQADTGKANGEFIGCFAGPSERRAKDCRSYDYDSDGDVDLADFRAYQVAYAGPTRTR